VALNFAGIGRTPQFAAGTSLSRVGSFAAMQRKTPALRPGLSWAVGTLLNRDCRSRSPSAPGQSAAVEAAIA
jgi:hypothetical protein